MSDCLCSSVTSSNTKFGTQIFKMSYRDEGTCRNINVTFQLFSESFENSSSFHYLSTTLTQKGIALFPLLIIIIFPFFLAFGHHAARVHFPRVWKEIFEMYCRCWKCLSDKKCGSSERVFCQVAFKMHSSNARHEKFSPFSCLNDTCGVCAAPLFTLLLFVQLRGDKDSRDSLTFWKVWKEY